jgi:signal transduction histidine kinase/CheY-like chemotaxis protein
MNWGKIGRSEHIVHFYEDDEPLIELVTGFLSAGLLDGEAAVVVATAPHRAALEQSLQAQRVPGVEALQEGRLVFCDAAELLSSFMRNGAPDPVIFSQVVGGTIERAARCSVDCVRVFGEMVDLLVQQGARAAALELELLWTELGRVLPFSLLCAYSIRRFASAADGEPFEEFCGQHSLVLPGESARAVAASDEQLRALARLEQRAHALETEVAERRRAEAALAEVNRRKDEFLAVLSHELRNPLSAVRTAVHAAQLDRDGERRERALAIAQRQTAQLTRLVDDLLDVARITQGRIQIKKQLVHLGEVLERAVESTRALIEERRHELSTCLSEPGVCVEADPARLEQVIGNLLSNAAKYTEPGGRIRVRAEQKGAEVLLRVADSGIGIAREMLDPIFEPFTQIGHTRDHQPGGLGIGLTVSRKLIELHGGRLEAQSEGPGQGTEFVVRLPAPAPAARAEGRAPAPPAGESQRRLNVMIVEDNRDAAEVLGMFLEGLGHSVVAAHDGDTATERAPVAKPDVVLIDIGLPGIDGYEVARRLKASSQVDSAVLVALTGYARAEDRQRAIAAGFDHHLVKPVDLAALRGLLDGIPAAS